jgi:hypothetical protein
MASVYCEFCGKEIKGIRKPEGLIGWTHNIARDVVRCDKHRRTSKLSPICRSHDAMTGEEK